MIRYKILMVLDTKILRFRPAVHEIFHSKHTILPQKMNETVCTLKKRKVITKPN